MNRVRLSALAAALLLNASAALIAQEKTMTTSTGMELVWIPPGEFVLGSTPEERDWAKSNGASQEYVDREGQSRAMIKQGFWLGRTEVTIEQWKRFVTDAGYVTDAEKKGWSIVGSERMKGAFWRDPKLEVAVTDKHPVCCISWNDAIAFCEWLTEAAKKSNKLAAGMIYRLPTEAEWEYACRAGTQTKFWWGDRVADGLKRAKWKVAGDTFLVPETVDNFGANGRNKFGLADMLGNVREWCLDSFDPAGAHGELYLENPARRVLRGGSFNHPAGVTRCAVREHIGTDFSYNTLGFRVCLGAPEGSGQSLGPITPAARTTSSLKHEPTPTTPIARPQPTMIADKESQKDAKKFARNQSSIKGLYIQVTSMGQRLGSAQDIIATVERANSNMETFCDVFGDIGKDTRISMEEAERLLKVRYPVWEAGRKIRFSYGEKYSKQAGGSAGGAFSVLLLSLLDGFQIDPGFAMTGDVTVDGKIRAVGAVAEKIRGARLEKCTMVAIPTSNKDSLNDLAILYTPAMFWSIQILSVNTLDDAAAVARLDKTQNLSKALMMFYQIQKGLGPYAPVAYLRNQDTYTTLQQVLQLAPNHLSAEFMLRAANNQLPTTLSLNGSVEEIWAASALMTGGLTDKKAPDPKKDTRYYVRQLPAEAIKVALERLSWLDSRLHPKTRDLKNAMADYIQSLDYLRRQSGASTMAYSSNLSKRDRVLGELVKLGTDRTALEEMMH